MIYLDPHKKPSTDPVASSSWQHGQQKPGADFEGDPNGWIVMELPTEIQR